MCSCKIYLNATSTSLRCWVHIACTFSCYGVHVSFYIGNLMYGAKMIMNITLVFKFLLTYWTFHPLGVRNFFVNIFYMLFYTVSFTQYFSTDRARCWLEGSRYRAQYYNNTSISLSR